MPKPDTQTDEVDDILDRQSPNVGFYYGEDDFYGLKSPAAPLAPGVPRGSSGAPLPPPVPSVTFTNAAQPTPAGNLQEQLSRMPLDQAAAVYSQVMRVRDDQEQRARAAYNAALKFQATRGYQNDLQAGKNPTEALVKWAPLMFSAPKEGTLGQAASMVRAGRPAPPVLRTANGQIFQVGTNGATALTPPVSRHQAANQLDVLDYRDKLKEMDQLRTKLAEDPNAKDKPMTLRRMRALQTELEQLRGRTADTTPAAPARSTTGTTPPPGAPTRIREVSRRTKGGRIAIFDADTKKFLRYADDRE